MKSYIIRKETGIMQEVDLASTDRMGFPPGTTVLSSESMTKLVKALGDESKLLSALGVTKEATPIDR